MKSKAAAKRRQKAVGKAQVKVKRAQAKTESRPLPVDDDLVSPEAKAKLLSMLQLAVPLWIERLRPLSAEQLQARAMELGLELASTGDMFVRASKPEERDRAFEVLAESLACMSFSRMGVAFEGLHWDSTAPQSAGAMPQWSRVQPPLPPGNSTAHYTPQSLADPIVARALEPILAALGEAPSSEQILSLKVCDPAMGSGAFLVSAARFLGDALVEAWIREGKVVATPTRRLHFA